MAKAVPKPETTPNKKAKKLPSSKTLNMQSMILRESRKLAFLICLCGLPIYLYILTIPEEKKLIELEEKLTKAEQREQTAIEENDRVTREINAYKSDPEYLEIIARDHLNYYKDGETVIRIKR